MDLAGQARFRLTKNSVVNWDLKQPIQFIENASAYARCPCFNTFSQADWMNKVTEWVRSVRNSVYWLFRRTRAAQNVAHEGGLTQHLPHHLTTKPRLSNLCLSLPAHISNKIAVALGDCGLSKPYLSVCVSNDSLLSFHYINCLTRTMPSLVTRRVKSSLNRSLWHFDTVSQAQWRRGSELDLWSSACTGAEVRFPLPALILLQSPWVRDLLYIT